MPDGPAAVLLAGPAEDVREEPGLRFRWRASVLGWGTESTDEVVDQDPPEASSSGARWRQRLRLPCRVQRHYDDVAEHPADWIP